jgi:hypothetical protein
MTAGNCKTPARFGNEPKFSVGRSTGRQLVDIRYTASAWPHPSQSGSSSNSQLHQRQRLLELFQLRAWMGLAGKAVWWRSVAYALRQGKAAFLRIVTRYLLMQRGRLRRGLTAYASHAGPSAAFIASVGALAPGDRRCFAVLAARPPRASIVLAWIAYALCFVTGNQGGAALRN